MNRVLIDVHRPAMRTIYLTPLAIVCVALAIAAAGAQTTSPAREALPADSNVANGTPPPIVRSIDPDPSTLVGWEPTQLDDDNQPIHPTVGRKSKWTDVRCANFTQTREGVEHREQWFEF